MKLSLALISTLLTSSLALSVKRQNDVPSCVNGDVADSNGGPYEGAATDESTRPATASDTGSDKETQNLTLRFFKDGHDDTCNYYDSRDALTFTTSSIPVVPHCFSLGDLFGGNATQGFVNQTWNLGSNRFGDEQAGIYWTLLNADKYDRSANYSRVLYRHHVVQAYDDIWKEGHLSNMMATVYGGEDCSELDPNDDQNLLNWFGLLNPVSKRQQKKNK
ncbi:uncharacterized protein J4E92_005216 [Alternaria infectoria]|uniref:uncharacterized protein n=1 Tax=Alternaria infectoria TaxID=45303 RepID=UPI00222063F4|nr:uncharacterized protein J4E92_005216 [Alternaria infectoria]KAI4929551.1 hypothetical protein J4E92_005216 [Alternaria infectoria]